MKNLLEEDFTPEFLQKIVNFKMEESINLEFKAAAALDFKSQKGDKSRVEFAKDISAFANSDGGVIIYGIKEQDQCAHSLDYIDANIIQKEALESSINSQIHKRIPRLEIIPVRMNDDLKTCIYVVKIPRSPDGPHQASDKKYYRRYNFLSVAMEEYEIRDAYSRISKAKLELGVRIAVRYDPASVTIIFSVKNVGRTVESGFNLEVVIPPDLHVYYKFDSQSGYQIYTTMNSEEKFAYVGICEQNIYPGQTVRLFSLSSGTNMSSRILLEAKKIKATLFYSTEYIEKVFPVVPVKIRNKLAENTSKQYMVDL